MANTIEARDKQADAESIIIIQKQPERKQSRGPRLLTVLLGGLLLIVLGHFFIVLQMKNTTVIPTSCAGLIRTTDYTQVVSLQPKSQEMNAVQFISQVVGGQPAALVQVNGTDTQHALDVYVIGCTMQHSTPKLVTLFTQHGLTQGTATISTENTLITSELDKSLTSDAAALMQPLQQNIYREYSWHNGTFVQVSFPSLYPVTSRTEAQMMQQEVNNGLSLPWNDPLNTAEQMSKDLFKWTESDPKDAVISNDGKIAQVLLVRQNPHMEVNVKLERLIQEDSNGLWFVVSAQTPDIALTSPKLVTADGFPTPVTGQVALQGTGALANGQTTASLFDHTLTFVALQQQDQNGGTPPNAAILNVDSSGVFTGTMLYSNNVPNQAGLLLIQSVPANQNGNSTDSTTTVPYGQLILMSVILG